MWLHLTKQMCLENLPFRHTCAGTTHKIAVANLSHPHLVHGQVSKCKASIFELAKSDEHWISLYQSHENTASMTSLGIVQKPALSVKLLFLPHRPFTHLATFHRLQTCLGFLLLLPLLLVVYQIQPSNVIELQHSPLSTVRSSNDNFTAMFV